MIPGLKTKVLTDPSNWEIGGILLHNHTQQMKHEKMCHSYELKKIGSCEYTQIV